MIYFVLVGVGLICFGGAINFMARFLLPDNNRNAAAMTQLYQVGPSLWRMGSVPLIVGLMGIVVAEFPDYEKALIAAGAVLIFFGGVINFVVRILLSDNNRNTAVMTPMYRRIGPSLWRTGSVVMLIGLIGVIVTD